MGARRLNLETFTYLAFPQLRIFPDHTERRAAKKEPVLLKDQYVTEVLNVMNQKHLVTFRDQAELHQATQFLHDNGVLLHYDDISLKVSKNRSFALESSRKFPSLPVDSRLFS